MVHDLVDISIYRNLKSRRGPFVILFYDVKSPINQILYLEIRDMLKCFTTVPMYRFDWKVFSTYYLNEAESSDQILVISKNEENILYNPQNTSDIFYIFKRVHNKILDNLKIYNSEFQTRRRNIIKDWFPYKRHISAPVRKYLRENINIFTYAFPNSLKSFMKEKNKKIKFDKGLIREYSFPKIMKMFPETNQHINKYNIEDLRLNKQQLLQNPDLGIQNSKINNYPSYNDKTILVSKDNTEKRKKQKLFKFDKYNKCNSLKTVHLSNLGLSFNKNSYYISHKQSKSNISELLQIYDNSLNLENNKRKIGCEYPKKRKRIYSSDSSEEDSQSVTNIKPLQKFYDSVFKNPLPDNN